MIIIEFSVLLLTNQLNRFNCNEAHSHGCPTSEFGELIFKRRFRQEFFFLDGFLYFFILQLNMPMNSNPSPSMEIKTIDDYKLQNDQYWTIIEKQRVIIKTMQKSLNHLTNENELLTKRNKELESSISSHSVISTSNSNNLSHHLLPTEATTTTTTTTTAAATLATPIVPPRSPYRINHNHGTHPLDAGTDIPKRPPVLKLAVSNHAQFQNREIDQPIGQKKTKSKVNHKRNHSQSNNNSNSINNSNNLNIPIMSKSKSEPSTPAHPRTPRYDSLHNFELENVTSPTTTTILRNLSNINVKIIASIINTNKKGFTIGILQKEDDREIWRIEKSLSDLISLDTNVKFWFCSFN
jgi:cell division septum initiation protein DivIVA